MSVHGEAARGDTSAFGCKEGVLAITRREQALTSKLVLNPDASTARVGTLIAHEKWPFFIGNFGPNALARIDVGAGTMSVFELPAPYVQFAFDHTGDQLLVLTKDGTMRLFAPATFAAGPTLAVTSAVTEDPSTTPQLAIAEHAVFVTDPQRAQVHRVDMERRVLTDSIPVAGSPAKIVVLAPE